MNEVLSTIITRRSCKSFLSKKIPDQMIYSIVEAGLYAASGLGQQSPIILVIKNKELRDRLSKINAKYDSKKRKDPFYGAPVVLVVLAPKSISTGIYDGSLVIGNMMLAAHSYGIGSCWIHRAKETFEDVRCKQLLKDLGLSEDYQGIGNCVLGYPKKIIDKIPERKENRVYIID